MTDKKLYTIDELMEGKEPGKVKVGTSHVCKNWAFYPYFQVDGMWHGLMGGGRVTLPGNDRDYHLWQPPKKKVTLRKPIMRLLTGDRAYFMPNYYHKDQEEVLREWSGSEFIRWATPEDLVSIEVEEE